MNDLNAESCVENSSQVLISEFLPLLDGDWISKDNIATDEENIELKITFH